MFRKIKKLFIKKKNQIVDKLMKKKTVCIRNSLETYLLEKNLKANKCKVFFVVEEPGREVRFYGIFK